MKPLVGGIVGFLLALGLGLWASSASGRELARRAGIALSYLGLIWAFSSLPQALIGIASLLRMPVLFLVAVGVPVTLGLSGIAMRNGASWAWAMLVACTSISLLLGSIALATVRVSSLLGLLALSGYLLGPGLLCGSAAWIWRATQMDATDASGAA